jgi:hypothetical protein
MLSPFTLFNGASFFNHMQAAVAVMAICWLQLRDEANESISNKLLIGFFLSIALVTRPEVFAITAFVLGIDYLVRQRLRSFRALPLLIAGALPVTALWLAYKYSITGNPLLTTYLWASPESVRFEVGSVTAFIDMATMLLRFSSAALLLLYVLALWTRLRSGAVRFYDLLFPGAVIFFEFFPNWAGHQYGPRYWFFAWPTIALTIGSTLSTKSLSAEYDDFIDIVALSPLKRPLSRQWRIHLPTLAAAQLVGYLSFSVVFAGVLRDYVDARRVVYTTPVPRQPAVVLIPVRQIRLSPWQTRPFLAGPWDFTRNGFGYNDPVLYGRADYPRMIERACTLPDRTVYVWESPSALRAVNCP